VGVFVAHVEVVALAFTKRELAQSPRVSIPNPGTGTCSGCVFTASPTLRHGTRNPGSFSLE
jgi:hypothetical protein